MPCFSFTSIYPISLLSTSLRLTPIFHIDRHLAVASQVFSSSNDIFCRTYQVCKERHLTPTFKDNIRRSTQRRSSFPETLTDQKLHLNHSRAMASSAIDQKTAAVIGAGGELQF